MLNIKLVSWALGLRGAVIKNNAHFLKRMTNEV